MCLFSFLLFQHPIFFCDLLGWRRRKRKKRRKKIYHLFLCSALGCSSAKPRQVTRQSAPGKAFCRPPVSRKGQPRPREIKNDELSAREKWMKSDASTPGSASSCLPLRGVTQTFAFHEVFVSLKTSLQHSSSSERLVSRCNSGLILAFLEILNCSDRLSYNEEIIILWSIID